MSEAVNRDILIKASGAAIIGKNSCLLFCAGLLVDRVAIELFAGLASDETKILPAGVFLKFL
jgi:hypothetical protein